ncbi:MAG: dephospho-CoA kinase [Pseudoxanthomonas sp.]
MSNYVIGLTGGIASGKSALERAFKARGVVVADADAVSREVVEPGQPALAAVAARFGAGILDADGRLDRAALRRRIFNNADDKRALEEILHPPIRQRVREICAAAAGPYTIAAIPLLAEGGGRAHYPWLDRILVVDAPEEMRLQRLLQRDGIDMALAQRMVDAQASREQRLAIADDIVVNHGTLAALDAAAAELDVRYRALAAA